MSCRLNETRNEDLVKSLILNKGHERGTDLKRDADIYSQESEDEEIFIENTLTLREKQALFVHRVIW